MRAEEIDDLAFATVGELAAQLDSGAVSSTELTQLALRRLSEIGPRYNALATLMSDRALAEAERADAARRRPGPRSPLLGIPYGAKDILAARGATTTYGSAAFRTQVLDYDATPVARLRRAGAVLAAKLALMEFAGFEGTAPGASVFGPGLSPWNPRFWAGGSSNGSAVAVAAGLVSYALASETGGSIGTPAACCGVTGLRPTYGLVSRHGSMAVAWSLDKIGVIARSARDCGLVLEAIAGRDRRDPASAGRRFTLRSADGESGRTDPLRLGYAPSDFGEAAAPEARPALDNALAVLGGIDAALVEVNLPPDLPYWESIATIIGAEGATNFAPIIEGPRLAQVQDVKARASMVACLEITARDYLDALRIRRLVQGAFVSLFRTVDLIVTFTIPSTAIPADVPFEEFSMKGGNTAMIAASNLAGLPALFLPCGFEAHGLPVGIQVVGPPFSEAQLIRLGQAFQRLTGWHLRRPPDLALTPATMT
jgi:aspartyl-tRNA(Asn)/glutamyl-tRNA(Gln) amidotransferase subunit A